MVQEENAHPLEREAGARAEAGGIVDGAVPAVCLQVDAACVAHDQPCSQATHHRGWQEGACRGMHCHHSRSTGQQVHMSRANEHFGTQEAG